MCRHEYILIFWQKSEQSHFSKRWTIFLICTYNSIKDSIFCCLWGDSDFAHKSKMHTWTWTNFFTMQPKEIMNQIIFIFSFSYCFCFLSGSLMLKVQNFNHIWTFKREQPCSYYWPCCDCVHVIAVHYDSLQSWAVKEKRMK